jgi:hypothetical protein
MLRDMKVEHFLGIKHKYEFGTMGPPKKNKNEDMISLGISFMKIMSIFGP